MDKVLGNQQGVEQDPGPATAESPPTPRPKGASERVVPGPWKGSCVKKVACQSLWFSGGEHSKHTASPE